MIVRKSVKQLPLRIFAGTVGLASGALVLWNVATLFRHVNTTYWASSLFLSERSPLFAGVMRCKARWDRLGVQAVPAQL